MHTYTDARVCIDVRAHMRARLQIAEIEITRPTFCLLCEYAAGKLARSLVPRIDANIPGDNSVAYLDRDIMRYSEVITSEISRANDKIAKMKTKSRVDEYYLL